MAKHEVLFPRPQERPYISVVTVKRSSYSDFYQGFYGLRIARIIAFWFQKTGLRSFLFHNTVVVLFKQ